MTRPPHPAEERVMRAQRQAGVVSAEQFRVVMDLLEASETCDKCAGTGLWPDDPYGAACDKCDGTGQMRTIR